VWCAECNGLFLSKCFSLIEARNYRRQWEILQGALLTGLSPSAVGDGGKGGLQDEPWLVASRTFGTSWRQMIHTACLDVGGAAYDIDLRTMGSATGLYFPLLGAHNLTSILQSKNPSFIHFCLHLE